MGKIRLTGATSGYTEIQAASAAGNNTIILPTTNGGQVIVSDSSGNVNIDSGTFYVDASNNRVGIGTTSPYSLLNLYGSTGLTLNLDDPNWQATAIKPINEGSSYRASLAFYTHASSGSAGSATERARIDSSGRLLVGTSSSRSVSGAERRVQVEGTTAAEGSISAVVNDNASAANAASLIVGRSRGTTLGSNTVVQNGDALGYIQFAGADGSNLSSRAAWIVCEVDGTPGTNDMPGRLVFSTTADGASSPTERMRITQDGLVGINTTNFTNGRLIIESDGTTVTPFVVRETASGTGSVNSVGFFRSSTLVGTISVTGSATAYNTSSDYRLKENVVPLTGAIDRINQLQVRRFNFIADPDKTFDGFIAHEAQAVVPECVTGTKDEVDADGNPVYQGIDQSKLVPLLTAALQEAIAELQNLKAEVADLKGA
jgi:hypothetical protein